MADQRTSTGRSLMSADDSRKMILNNYELKGEPLPLIQFETVLDKDALLLGENNNSNNCSGGGGGGPRFRNLLKKGRKDKDVSLGVSKNKPWINDINDDDNDNKNDNDNEAFSNDNTQPQRMTSPPNTISNAIMTETKTEITTTSNSSSYPPTDDGTNMRFDLCCPDLTMESPKKENNKYVISKLQLAEGFDDEYHSEQRIGNSRIVALIDIEESMMNTSIATEEKHSTTKGRFRMAKNDIFTHFRGSRRFRVALTVCCGLHLILVGLIIAFVMTLENDTTETNNGYEDAAAASSSIALVTPGQAKKPATSTTNIIDENNMSTSNLSLPYAPFPEEEQKQESNNISSTPTTTTVSIVEENTTSAQQDYATVIGQEVSTELVVFNTTTTAATISSPATQSEACVDRLELSLNCFGSDNEVLVYFQSCVPQSGDWVAIFDVSHDPANLLDSDSIAWLYTCGSRRCNQPVQNEVLSFSRITDRVQSGRYRAHLIREGRGPIYSSFARSSEFKVVDNPYTDCEERRLLSN